MPKLTERGFEPLIDEQGKHTGPLCVLGRVVYG
jgi:hypothetical protein